MGLNTKCKFHDNEHPDFACPRIEKLRTGPDKVVVTERGDLINPNAARAAWGFVPTVIFFADSGNGQVFSVGAPAHLEEAARKMAKWLAISRFPFTDFEPFEG